jgi:hypothetical protein
MTFLHAPDADLIVETSTLGVPPRRHLKHLPFITGSICRCRDPAWSCSICSRLWRRHAALRDSLGYCHTNRSYTGRRSGTTASGGVDPEVEPTDAERPRPETMGLVEDTDSSKEALDPAMRCSPGGRRGRGKEKEREARPRREGWAPGPE